MEINWLVENIQFKFGRICYVQTHCGNHVRRARNAITSTHARTHSNRSESQRIPAQTYAHTIKLTYTHTHLLTTVSAAVQHDLTKCFAQCQRGGFSLVSLTFSSSFAIFILWYPRHVISLEMLTVFGLVLCICALFTKSIDEILFSLKQRYNCAKKLQSLRWNI